MPKLFIFDAFTLLIREKTVANYALLRCKTFSLKIWVCKFFDKFHVCALVYTFGKGVGCNHRGTPSWNWNWAALDLFD